MDWTAVFKTVGLGAAALTAVGGALAWIARGVATRWLDAQVDVFREQLKRESLEHQVQFESLHVRRAEAILLIWRALRYAKRSVNGFVHPVQSGGFEDQEQRGKDAGKHVQEFSVLVFDNLIFFRDDLAKKLNMVAHDLETLWYRAWRDFKKSLEKDQNPYFSDFEKAWEKLQSDIEPLIPELEHAFRALLGVSGNGPTAE